MASDNSPNKYKFFSSIGNPPDSWKLKLYIYISTFMIQPQLLIENDTKCGSCSRRWLFIGVFKCMFGLYWKQQTCTFVFFLCRSCALFMGPVSSDFKRKKIKTKSHSTTHTFKNYFATIFSVFSFQFLGISDIQTELKKKIYLYMSTLVI